MQQSGGVVEAGDEWDESENCVTLWRDITKIQMRFDTCNNSNGQWMMRVTRTDVDEKTGSKRDRREKKTNIEKS